MVTTVHFMSEPARIMYMPLPDGYADVWLRKNIRSETDDDGTVGGWVADEVYLHTDKSRADVESDFDSFFATERTSAQRIEELEAAISDLSSLITTETEQSDKLGYNWEITKVGKIEVSREYVAQENPRGTRDNPITYYDGVPLIDNAYYLKDGKRQVYMSGTWTEF